MPKNEKDILTSQGLQETLELFWLTVPPIWHATRALTQKVATEEFSITPSKFHALRRIVEGHRYVSQLAGCLHLSRPNVSRMVDELVNDGFIEREPNPQDRRNIRLLLTEKGQHLFDMLHARIQTQMEEFFSRLNAQELEEVNCGLRNMHKLSEFKESPVKR